MRCPTLEELPPPPDGKTGWPWTLTSPPVNNGPTSRRHYPRISIITPSLNQGQFIEETLRSVLLQGYPDLEFIIIDGASTDQTNDVIRKYDPWLSHWESTPDRGQAHAINKGLKKSTGEIFHWVNSDDVLLPNALSKIGNYFRNGRACLFSVINFCDYDGAVFHHTEFHSDDIGDPGKLVPFHQPGMVLPRRIYQLAGGLSEDIHFSFDAVLFLFAINNSDEVKIIRDPVVKFRIHPSSKTSNQALYLEEQVAVFREMRSVANSTIQSENISFQERVAIASKEKGLRKVARLASLYVEGALRYHSVIYHKNMLKLFVL